MIYGFLKESTTKTIYIMKTKYYQYFLITLFTLFQFNTLIAQDNEECTNNLSIFAELAKVKDYGKAYEPWLYVKENCPSLNTATYTYGEKILEFKIKNATSEEEKNQFTSDLINLYDLWLANFPNDKRGKNNTGALLSDKAHMMYTYKYGTNKEIYNTFEEAFTKDANSFTNPKFIYEYFKVLYLLYKEKDKDASLKKLVEKYEELLEKLELEENNLGKRLDALLKKEAEGTPLTTREVKLKKAYSKNTKAYSIFEKNLHKLVAKEATCETLIPLYQSGLEENKHNITWLRRSAKNLEEEGCTESKIFSQIVEIVHTEDPSANSAYFLGVLKDKQNKNQEAIKYYNEAIKMETDSRKKAKYLYKVALKFKKQGKKSLARDYARRSLKFQPSLGASYLLIAELYASSANDCGDTQFNKRAVYWLAANTARKAGVVNSSLKKTANQTVESYMGRAPNKTDIFTEGNQGATIKFTCWINSSVTVPEL